MNNNLNDNLRFAPRSLSLEQAFNSDIKRVFTNAEKENREAIVPMLLCPDYPHEGTQFTYDSGQQMGEGPSPTLPIFTREVDKLVSSLKSMNYPLELVHLNPMVCEIESDLPNVLDKFAGGSEEVFRLRVNNTAIASAKILKKKYPMLRITPSNFGDTMLNLNMNRELMNTKINNLLENGGLPNEFRSQLEFVTQNRALMFQKLYGATEYSEVYSLAVRQMVNYLAVTRSLAQTFTNGCAVLNVNTPNAKYVKSKERMLRPILEIPPNLKVPSFYFF